MRGRLQVPQVPWTKKKTRFVDTVSRFVCVLIKQISALSKLIYSSYLLELVSYGATSLYVIPCISKLSILRLQDTGFKSQVCKILTQAMFSLGLHKDGFYKNL